MDYFTAVYLKNIQYFSLKHVQSINLNKFNTTKNIRILTFYLNFTAVYNNSLIIAIKDFKFTSLQKKI